jgi:four helix bundle protein
MNFAQGSLEECRYYLILSKDLGYAKTDSLLFQVDGIGKLLSSYVKAVAESISYLLSSVFYLLIF